MQTGYCHGTVMVLSWYCQDPGEAFWMHRSWNPLLCAADTPCSGDNLEEQLQVSITSTHFSRTTLGTALY